MTYEVNFDQFSLQCEVTVLVDEPPDPWATSSDWDAYGDREMEFRVVSALVYDENGVPSDAGRNACAQLAEDYAELIEDKLWRQIEAARQDIA
ncbi:hypothetical protein PkP19E3_33475 (plasmid) [Pseudomonas koreensis]|nr:hypothetical protein PkP19E3_33475 [Pseudomonas koreensis]